MVFIAKHEDLRLIPRSHIKRVKHIGTCLEPQHWGGEDRQSPGALSHPAKLNCEFQVSDRDLSLPIEKTVQTR